MINFNDVWLNTISAVLSHGALVAPRGNLTKELPQFTVVVDTRRPVLTVRDRKLSYKFMAAEAAWILLGDDRVDTIEPYNKHITQFSDDGKTFAGAYGPRIVCQLEYVVSKLLTDRDTRQAGLTIWRENPRPSKDIPCTVSIFFNIRENKVNAHVFMRSSDVWLGLPYDVFNFSMLVHLICGHLNKISTDTVTPGTLYLTAASTHLYECNWAAAEQCLGENRETICNQPRTPDLLYLRTDDLTDYLLKLRDSSPGDPLRWWETLHETN